MEQGTVRYVRYANLLFQISGVVILLRDCLRKRKRIPTRKNRLQVLFFPWEFSCAWFTCFIHRLPSVPMICGELTCRREGMLLICSLPCRGCFPRIIICSFTSSPCTILREPFFKAAKRTSQLFGSVLSGGCGQDGFLYRVLLQSADCLCHFQGMRTFGKGSVPGFAPCLLFAGLFSERRKAGTGCSLRNVHASGISFYPEMGKEKNWKNTLLLAVIYGLGMMTKISMATLAVFTAVVFARSFFKACKTGTWKGLLLKYAVFGAISLPLGLWYSLRNYLLFRQPLTYVLEMSRDSALYTGDRSIWQRLFFGISGTCLQLPMPMYGQITIFPCMP